MSVFPLRVKSCGTPETYFHGGADGLQVGDVLLPRKRNPLWKGVVFNRQGVPPGEYGDEGLTVSLTSDIDVARAYAGEYNSPPNLERIPGRVYEVRPLREPIPDPDWVWSFPHISRCALGAEIVATLEQVPVEPNPRELVKALGAYWSYTTTGNRVLDEEGYVIFTREMESLGHTAASLRALGKWPEKHRYIAMW